MNESPGFSVNSIEVDAPTQVPDSKTKPVENEDRPNDNKLRIFLSHKQKSATIAETIKEELESYGADRLDIFLSEGISYGEDWSKQIHQELRTADWLFLLYTEPTADYDWCLYEAGFFAARLDRRLICLYSSGLEPPGPLKRWQAVRGIKKDWEKLLKELYGDPPRPGVTPLNPRVANSPQRLSEIAGRIVQVVGRKPSREYYNCFLLVDLNKEQADSLKQTDKIPNEAEVESDARSLRLFDLSERSQGKWTWGDLIRELKGPGQRGWINSLGVSMRQALLSKKFAPALSLFEPRTSDTPYRPVIHRLDRLPSGTERFMITLIEIPTGEDPLPPSDLGRIYILLRMARIFRWGVLAKYSSEINSLRARGAGKREIDVCLEGLDLSIRSLEAEANRLKLYDVEPLIAAFSKQEEKDQILQMFESWGELRQSFNEKRNAKDLVGLLEILKTMRMLNKQFLLLGGKRSIELIERL
jgi:hypothetical protein